MPRRLAPVFVVFGSLLLATLGVWFFISRPNDDEVIGLMLRNIARLESFEYHGALSFAGDRTKASSAPLFDAVFYNKGILGMRSSDKPDITNSFEARVYIPEGRYGFRGDFIRTNNSTHVRLGELPSFGLLNLTDIIGRWFVVPALWDASPLTREIRPLASTIATGDAFQSVTRLADESIDGRSVYHLQARVTPQVFSDFARTAILGQGGTAHEAEQAAIFVRERLTVKTVDLWVTKRGFDVYRIRVLGDVQLDTFAPANVIASVDMRRHNHSFDIAVPAENAASVETVLAPIGARIGMTGFQTGSLVSQLPDMPDVGGAYVSRESFAVFGADTDRDGLTNVMEHVYGTDPLNPDSDMDGYRDGVEVERGYNPLGSGSLR